MSQTFKKQLGTQYASSEEEEESEPEEEGEEEVEMEEMEEMDPAMVEEAAVEVLDSERLEAMGAEM